VRDELLRAGPEVPGVQAIREAFAAGWLKVRPVVETEAVLPLTTDVDRGEEVAAIRAEGNANDHRMGTLAFATKRSPTDTGVTESLRLYPSGGVSIGFSPSDPGAGVLRSEGGVAVMSAAGDDAAVTVDSPNTSAYLLARINGVGKGYLGAAGQPNYIITGSAPGDLCLRGEQKILIGGAAGAEAAITVYATRGVHVGSAPADPGANNLQVQGTVLAGSSVQVGSRVIADSGGSFYAP
jgi:hypothetical protein